MTALPVLINEKKIVMQKLFFVEIFSGGQEHTG